MRPGRFDRHIYISLPDYEGRVEIFKILMKRMPFSESFTPHHMADLTDGFSGAEITSLCQNSAIRSLERDILSLKVIFVNLALFLHYFIIRSSGKTLNFVYPNLRNKLITNP